MIITDLLQLEALYDAPPAASTVKEMDRLTPDYKRLIQASPFIALATCGPEGLDCSPRGDQKGVVTIQDDRTLLLPDRRGNNRLDSLRNIVRDSRVSLLFLIPGSGTTFRVNGRAVVSAEPDLLARLAVDGHAPRTVIIVTIERCYFQCARAIVRSRIWNADTHVDQATLPTPGKMLSQMSNGAEGGAGYDAGWPERAARTLW